VKRAAVAAAVTLSLTIAACGIPRESSPRLVHDNDVPFGLLDTSTTVVPPPAG
jgi:hypothetical protein